MKIEKTIVIPSEHPALAGHFPGNPIVPGVVLLDELAQALKEAHPEIKLAGMPSVKFMSPLRPGEPCTMVFSEGRNHTIKFECRSGERVIATGSFSQAAPEEHAV